MWRCSAAREATGGPTSFRTMGERDGENILEAKDADGRLFVKEMVDSALNHPSGEITTRSYMWKNPGRTLPAKSRAC